MVKEKRDEAIAGAKARLPEVIIWAAPLAAPSNCLLGAFWTTRMPIDAGEGRRINIDAFGRMKHEGRTVARGKHKPSRELHHNRRDDTPVDSPSAPREHVRYRQGRIRDEERV